MSTRNKRRRDGRSTSSSRDEQFELLNQKVAELQQEVNDLKKRKIAVSPRNEERYDDGFERRKEKWLRQRFGRFRFDNSSSSDNKERFSCRQLANEFVPLEKRSEVKRDPSLEKPSIQSRLRRVYSPLLPPYRPKDERESFEDQSYSTNPKLRSEMRCKWSDDVLRCCYCKIRGHMSNVCWFRLRDLGYETPLDYLGYEQRESRSRVREFRN